MTVAKITENFDCDVQKVWDIVTDLNNYSWRSDLSKIDIVSTNQFVEYTQKGYATKFVITKIEDCRRWEFDMENDNMKGHWSGEFSFDGKKTTIDFTESIVAKKLLMKPLVGVFLKKQQSRYIIDLKKAIEKV